jgi:transposase-like protein
MPTCLICRQPPTKRDGDDRRGRQRYTCRPCRRDFTQLSGSAFSGYRWPAEVILAGMRWYLRYPLSARQVAELLAERGVDVSARTVLSWVQTFGPLLAKESDRCRRQLGRRWYVDELFLCRGGKKHYLYRAVDHRGQVVVVLLRGVREVVRCQLWLRQTKGAMTDRG